MKTLLLTIAVASCGLSALSAQLPVPSRVFTAAQADAGRVELQNNAFGACSDCHTTTLTGRKGDADELPALSSLPDGIQKSIRSYGGRVPPLAGANFVARWGARSTKALSADMLRRFANLSEQTRLDIMAYILQLNGALPGAEPLTAATDVEIRSLTSAAER
jgi:cytochrome c553